MSAAPLGAGTGRAVGRSVARAAFGIGVVTAAARVVGFLRVAVFAHTVGAAPLGDTYQTANTLPNIVFEIVAGGALAAAVVPVVAAAADRGDRDEAARTTSALLTWVVVLLAPVAILGALLGRPLMTLLAGGTADPALRAAKVDVGARMLVVFMPQVVLYGVGVVLTGVLQAHRRFIGPALAPLLSSVVVIAAYVTYASVAAQRGSLGGLTRGEELLLSVGTTLGVAVLALSLLVPLRSVGLALRPSLRLPDGVAVRVRALAASAVAGVVAQQVALAVVLRLCNVEPGAVVVYQIAYTLFLLPWGVLAVPVATSAFPGLAAAYSSSDPAAFADVTARSLRSVLLLMGLAAAVLVAAAGPLTVVVAGAQPGLRAVAPGALPDAVAAFAPGLLGYGALALLTRALYARHRGRAVAAVTVTAYAVAAALAVLLVATHPYGLSRVAAIGIANSLGMSLAGAALVVATRRAAGAAAVSGALRVALAAVAAGAVAAYAGRAGARLGSGLPTLARAALAAVVAAAVYGAPFALARLARPGATRPAAP